MLLCLLLLVSGVACVPLKAENPLLCVNLAPLKNITLKQFQGHWMLHSIFEFTDGIPAPSESERSEECNWFLYENATERTMDEYTEELTPSHWEEPAESFHSKLYVMDGEPGRWIFNTSVPDTELVSEEDQDDQIVDDMVIVLADPNSFLIAASCSPRAADVPEHERFVKLVSIMSRRDGRKGRVLVDDQQLLGLEEWTARVLKFSIVPHVQQRTDC